MNVKDIIEKYKDTIPYLFFGVCTTLVNIVVYWVCAHPFASGVMFSTITAWVAAVLFAYLTNRKWVFCSKAKTFSEVAKELLSFFGCRLATGFFDWACMFVFVVKLEWNDVVMKIAANFIVVILNYVASKFIIFRNKNTV